MKIGLCLSGGGIKGVAHIGVIKALEEENIKIDCIAGSIGIMTHELYNYEVEGIEYLIKINTKDVWLLDIDKTEELYKLGYQTAKKEMNKIKEYLRK